jgi:hypothetical protein
MGFQDFEIFSIRILKIPIDPNAALDAGSSNDLQLMSDFNVARVLTFRLTIILI